MDINIRQTPTKQVDLKTALIENHQCLIAGQRLRYDMRDLVREGIRAMAKEFRLHGDRPERMVKVMPELRLLIDGFESVTEKSPSPSECYEEENYENNMYGKAR